MWESLKLWFWIVVGFVALYIFVFILSVFGAGYKKEDQ